MRGLKLRSIGALLAWFSVLVLLSGCTPGGQVMPPVPQSLAGTSAELEFVDAPAPVATPTASETPDPTSTAQPEVTRAPSATPSATLTTTATASPAPTPSPTPGPTPDGVGRQLRVPILMYHYVSEPPADADIYRRDLSVAPERFETHLAYLREAGYQTITLDDLLYGLAQGRPLPPKAVILTFDDGYEDNYTAAFPILRSHEMVAHFFIITDFVNQGRTGYMTWPQIEEMAAAGQRFGSHSRDHPDLRGKPVDYLVWQALGGKESLEEHLGEHPRWISYPAGSYDAQVMAVYRSAHYWGGLSTRQGTTHALEGIFELRRVRVRGSHTAEDLAELLSLEW